MRLVKINHFSCVYTDSRIHYDCIRWQVRVFIMIPLSISRIYYEFTVSEFGNLVWNQLSSSSIHLEFTIISWIHFDSSISLANWLFIYSLHKRIQRETIIYFRIKKNTVIFSLNSRWINNLFREFFMNTLFSRIHLESRMFIEN